MVTEQLVNILKKAVEAARSSGDLSMPERVLEITLELPRNKQFGDFACNVALTLAKDAGLPPRVVAERIAKYVAVGNGLVDRVEVAGPGFLNFYLQPGWLQDALPRIESEDTHYGFSRSREGERTLIEFVSANPTGPISVVNGRAAALGDTLANLLAASGAVVSREFYVNDALNSTQIDLMGASLAARYFQLLGQDREVPEDGYHGEYIAEIAKHILEQAGDEFANLSEAELAGRFRELAVQRMIAQQRSDLEAFGVVYDTWFFESSLYESDAVKQSIEEMKQRGVAYEKDGALWLKSSELTGDDQDRVLVRSNEKATYVAADAAYHKNKFDRGFNRLINIWGADHHGYVSRLKAGVKALGNDPDKCEIILTQMVLLMRDGEPVRGSKRAGDIILLSDLVDEIGKDAARFYFMLNSYETTATFDLNLAKKQSSENPVFYAQYAHARCASVLRKAEESGVQLKSAAEVERSLLTHEKELDLLRKLAEYPNEVKLTTDLLAPHRLTGYVREIGQSLHQFYEECPALREGIDPPVRDARLSLFNATRIVVRNLLTLLGVSAPDKM